jgi:hypothetical protein
MIVKNPKIRDNLKLLTLWIPLASETNDLTALLIILLQIVVFFEPPCPFHHGSLGLVLAG